MAKEPKASISLDRWQIEEDLRTLTRAEEIKADKKRYAAAVKYASERISDLRDIVADAAEEASEEGSEKD
ncbi:hypothetical protein PSQ40_04905 [Curvibacter sp. HBC61]|uniref:Uncharacterized protein n=1 Tax=Curvibacter cyanobacteriorum TaxID=3026422 RepID=A0ABT5MVH6_9BURK|nr:hypothetical protein [Curvibacter sp. HBC61]MDD0837905.1 hypothetical protein [Curvibacter sp. HBC61]